MEGNTYVKDTVARLIRNLGYRPEEPISDDNVLYQALKTEFAEYNTGDWFDVLCRESATIAEVEGSHFSALTTYLFVSLLQLPYSGHSDEIRIQIARFTWYVLHICACFIDLF